MMGRPVSSLSDMDARLPTLLGFAGVLELMTPLTLLVQFKPCELATLWQTVSVGFVYYQSPSCG